MINIKNKGFTIVEMLVVMTIVAVLLAISLVSYAGSRKMARDSKRKADIESVRSALEVYRTDCHKYPDTADIVFNGTAQIVGIESECLNYVYLEDTPADPLDPNYSYYYQSPSSNIYLICAALESPVTTNTCSGHMCGTVSCNYGVSNP